MKRRLETCPGNCFLCCTECENKCDECEVFFCSSSHLTVHKQTGKCSPWVVETRPGVGRVVLAARDIQVFELVMRDHVMLGRVQVDSQACVLCGELLAGSDSRRCGCGFERCKSECPDSQHHLQECSALKKLNIINLPLQEKNGILSSLGFRRMIKLQESDPEKWKSLINLMSHQEKKTKLRLFQQSVNFLKESLELIGVTRIDVNLLSRLQGILETNSHAFNKNIHMIFGIFSLISHSCIPNSEHLLSGEQAIVRAKVMIMKGEEITIRYSDLCLHREILKEQMETSWLFSCHCPRCEDGSELGTEASFFKCKECENGFVGGNGSTFSCKNCGKVMTFKQFVSQANRLREVELSCKSREEIPKHIEELEKKGSHALYHSVIQLKIKFIEGSLDKMNSRTCHLVREYIRDVDRYMEALNPGVSRLRGRLLVCVRKAETWLLENGEGIVDTDTAGDIKKRLMEQKMMNGYFKS